MTTAFLDIKDTLPFERLHRRRQWAGVFLVLRTITTFLLILAFGFFIVSGPAQLERIGYFLEQLRQGTEQRLLGVSINDWLSPSAFLDNPMVEAEPVVRVPVPEFADNHLVIPDIEVDAPILWNIPLVDSLNGLQQGVVQAQESYYPGEVGRTFIIGHSAGYWWNKNPWTRVFALLDQLEPGDMIYLRRDGQKFAYRVSGEEVVTPSDVRVVRDDTLDHSQLALMTCTPVGTTLNRLIVYAEPVAVAG